MESRKYKIIQFITSLSDGGAETLVKDYAHFLNKEQFDVSVLCCHNVVHTANYKRMKESGSRIISIYPTYNFFFRCFNKLFGRWYIPYRLSKIMEREKPNGLHIHLSLLSHVNKIRKQLKNQDVDLFYTCHSLPKYFFDGKRKTEGGAVVDLIKNNDLQIIALHEDMAKEINERFGIENAAVIRNGCDFSRFRTVEESKESARSTLGIPKDAFVLGHVGRFSEVKNHDYLVDIFCEIKKQNPNAYLLMVGAGALKKQIEEKLSLLGLAESFMILSHRSDVPFLLKTMDVFVFPSFFEGLSVTLVEAQAAGLRCVVSDSVNKANILNRTTVAVSLSESVEKWCEVIRTPEIVSDVYGNLEDYDMKNAIKGLEGLYLSKREQKQ